MKLFTAFFLTLTTLSLFFDYTEGHYCQSCSPIDNQKLNIHFISHTHLDTGWLHSYDQYFHRNVISIYNSVIEALQKNPDRRFIAVETSFFSRWYDLLPDSSKEIVKQLVSSGRLEFISGGWSMNDEATAHYSAIIDNMSVGHKWLNATFGRCGITKTAWQIDPFGHSREQASLFAQMGFDTFFLGRIDFQDIEQRRKSHTLEFIWKSSPSIGTKNDIFSSILPNVYWPPTEKFCYDMTCRETDISSQERHEKAIQLVEMAKQQAQNYSTKHTVFTFGMDFNYEIAEMWFRNLDVLIDTINEMSEQLGVKAYYSTPSCYAKGLSEENNRVWPVKLDDFFPYAMVEQIYWTGFYTSRPSLKLAIRKGTNLLHVANQLSVLSLQGVSQNSYIESLRRTMGILQHHDAVTGTCRQHVADDYQRMLSESSAEADLSIIASYMTLTNNRVLPGQSVVGFCPQLNVSSCPYTEYLTFDTDSLVSVYNSIAHSVRHFVRLPVRDGNYRVLDHHERLLPSQLIPLSPSVIGLKERNSKSTHELVFLASLEPFGISSYLVQESDIGTAQRTEKDLLQPLQDVVLHNGKIGITIDGTTGLVKEMHLANGQKIPFVQSFWYYRGQGRVYSGEIPSGAYIFNPSHHNPYIVNTRCSFEVFRGPLVDEVHQVFSDFVTQIIRLYKNYSYIEFDWVIGPLPGSTNRQGIEVVTRYETNFASKGMFYTDSNGRETLRRTRDHRATFKVNTTERVASNYYPITSWAFIRDVGKELQMSVLTDRSQGGSSMLDGTLELMLHRRLFYDDHYGMEEELNEAGVDHRGLVVRGKHRVVVDKIEESVRFLRKLSKTSAWAPTYLFRNVPTAQSLSLLSNLQFSGLQERLPVNIHLLSLEQWDNERVLLRLEHFYEINEDYKYSRDTRIKLNNLFSTFVIQDIEEVTLSGSENAETAEKGKFKFTADSNPYENYTSVFTQLYSADATPFDTMNDRAIEIIMKPMEIRTFLLRIAPRNNY